MTSIGEPRHHFRPGDPAEVVDRPDPTGGSARSEPIGPQPPKPWWYLIARQWPLFVTLIVVTTGLVLALASYWRRGATVVGAGVLLGSLLRLVLPEKTAGLLCCRSRWFDTALTFVLGAAIVVLAWVISPTRK